METVAEVKKGGREFAAVVLVVVAGAGEDAVDGVEKVTGGVIEFGWKSGGRRAGVGHHSWSPRGGPGRHHFEPGSHVL